MYGPKLTPIRFGCEQRPGVISCPHGSAGNLAGAIEGGIRRTKLLGR
jgi:hypothetical protein